jgi:glycosyltransferase involved in cell wall biosynthesis
LKQRLVMLAKGDALLRSDSCLGIGVLDERFIPAMESYTGKDTVMFPDFTDTSLPAEPVDLAQDIVRKAAGRKIVGMIGLERRKGILTLLRTAELARKRGLPLYFACAGRIFRSEFSEEEWNWIGSLDRSNLHLDPAAGRIPTEAGFNSVFSVFDIAWAAYENFQGSSNTLGKAAAFGIPCIASKSGCIGHRVENYGSGLTIPEGDVEKATAALAELAEQGQMPEPRYEDFRNDHSIRKLDELLGGLLEKL